VKALILEVEVLLTYLFSLLPVNRCDNPRQSVQPLGRAKAFKRAFSEPKIKGNLKLKVGFASKAIQPSVALEASEAFSLLSSSAFSSF
jgi:hypothetical protein